jgi:hypothetical protein
MFYKNHDFVKAILLTPFLIIEILRLLLWKLSRKDLKSVKAILLGIFNGVLRIPLALKSCKVLKCLKTPFTYFDLKVDLELILGRFYKTIFKGGK